MVFYEVRVWCCLFVVMVGVGYVGLLLIVGWG